MVAIAGYFACALIGLSLGMIGGGGAILTIPVLVYLFGMQTYLATSYSMFIVGCTSFSGTIIKWKEGNVNGLMALWFGLPSVITIYITRHFILPAIPEHLAFIGKMELTRSVLMLLLFAVVMIFASLSMILPAKKETEAIGERKFISILPKGIFIGLLTGLVGAGGGFIIIPALVLNLKVPMKQAIGTSLLIITVNSLIGFLSDLKHIKHDWHFLITVTIISIAGIFIGNFLGRKIKAESLRSSFGYFVLITGTFILLKELFRF